MPPKKWGELLKPQSAHFASKMPPAALDSLSENAKHFNDLWRHI
jgi:hypothetical protein